MIDADTVMRNISGGVIPLTESLDRLKHQFDLEVCFARMKNGESYTCLGTLDWVQPIGGPTPLVSVDARHLERKCEWAYPKGTPPRGKSIERLQILGSYSRCGQRVHGKSNQGCANHLNGDEKTH